MCLTSKMASVIIVICCAVIRYLSLDLVGAQVEPQPLIVGGETTNIEKYPYQIQLLSSGQFICGGSILSKNYILTAAHCTNRQSPRSMSIRAGSSTLSGSTVVRVSTITQHPQFSMNTLDYDVSVLKLASSLTYSSKIKSIPLRKSQPSDGTEATITGWGYTSENGQIARQLQVAKVPTFNWSKCKSVYSTLTARMMCAGTGSKDSCSGDSGGPLVTSGQLTGVVSWGNGCARPGYPGVYASVSSLYSWIVSKVVFD